MVRVAGAQVADGLVAHPMFTGRYVGRWSARQLAAAAPGAGRAESDVAVTGILMCTPDDVAEGRQRLAFALAQYAASRSTTGSSSCTAGPRSSSGSARRPRHATSRRWRPPCRTR